MTLLVDALQRNPDDINCIKIEESVSLNHLFVDNSSKWRPSNSESSYRNAYLPNETMPPPIIVGTREEEKVIPMGRPLFFCGYVGTEPTPLGRRLVFKAMRDDSKPAICEYGTEEEVLDKMRAESAKSLRLGNMLWWTGCSFAAMSVYMYFKGRRDRR
mmetsp:Transcript_33925/g.106363  ORF Transcript_33925/g.106363 Transcript_33925/m.106363 type:complete len:158 (-) Transcript_33925:56-529(-)